MSLLTIVLAFGSAALVGCSPTPEPTPTPTPAFASEEEAFAAAEETFASYNEALNQVDPSNPKTFEPLFELSSGTVEKADRENFSTMHAEGWTIEGDSRILSFNGTSSNPPYFESEAEVCLDVSAVRIADRAGTSMVDPGRPNVYPLLVTFKINEGDRLLIDSAMRSEDVECAS